MNKPEENRKVVYVDGIPMISGKPGDFTAWLLWYGGRLLLLLVALGLLGSFGLWLESLLGG